MEDRFSIADSKKKESSLMQDHHNMEPYSTWTLLNTQAEVSPETATTSIPPIISLPLELKRAILSFLPDVTSLRTAILTCRTFYSTYLEAESFLLADVLGQEIPAKLILDALAAHDASKLGETTLTWSPEKVAGIMLRFDGKHSGSLARPWKLADAWNLSNLHKTIQIFSLEFVDAAVLWSEEDDSVAPKLPSRKPSSSEIQRIQRSFYRYETFSNLFRARPPSSMAPRVLFDPLDQHLLFFKNFPAWEIEQMVCVHEFLLNVLETRNLPTCIAFDVLADEF